MSLEDNLRPITRGNLDEYMKDLGKEFRKLNGTKTKAEIILTGGAAVLVGYGFRELTYDVDAVIHASSVMKDAINRTGDKHGLPNGWLNTDFTRTMSYSDKLREVSVYYRTFSNVLQVRTIAAEYLLAMKLMSGRQYKYDLSDIVGILWEHQKSGNLLSQEMIKNAVVALYGTDAVLPEVSEQLLSAVFNTDNYETLYRKTRESEIESKELLLEFVREHSNELKAKSIDSIINERRRKRATAPQKDSLLALLEETKAETQKINASH